MFDVWSGGVELTTLVWLVSAVLVLPGQLALCFRVRRRLLRLLPTLTLTAFAAVCLVLGALSAEWDALGWFLLAALALIPLLLCGVGWAVWGLLRRLRR